MPTRLNTDDPGIDPSEARRLRAWTWRAILLLVALEVVALACFVWVVLT